MNWKLEYIKQREDRMFEARLQEDEGLFVIGITSNREESAIKEAEDKVLKVDHFAIISK